MSPETTHPSLLSRLRDGNDQEAWQDFDSQYRELLLRYCRTRGLQEADAQDVRQIVMMSLAKSLKTFQYSADIGRFRSYLGRVVKNAIAKWLSSPRTRRAGLVDFELDGLAPAAELAGEDECDALWEREWMHHHLREALRRSRVSFDTRTLQVFEQLLGGQSIGNVAAQFGTTRDAVHKIKQRVGAHLEVLVSEQIRNEEFEERQ